MFLSEGVPAQMALGYLVHYRIAQGIKCVIEIIHRLVCHLPVFIFDILVVPKFLDQVETAFGCNQLVSPDYVNAYVDRSFDGRLHVPSHSVDFFYTFWLC